MATSLEMVQQYYKNSREALNTNDVETALENLRMAEALCEDVDDKNMYVNILNGFAISYGVAGRYGQMAQTIVKALDYLDKNQIRGAKHFFYSAICDRYMMLKDYDSAINYGLMAAQDLEENGKYFRDFPGWNLVTYLNLSYSYLETCRYNQAMDYLEKAKKIAQDNDIKKFNYTFTVLEARLKYSMGDENYVKEHMSELTNINKNDTSTLEDFIQDIRILVNLLIMMNDYEQAILVVKNVEFSFGLASNESDVKREAAKLYMNIYKASGNEEGYKRACVMYAESDLESHKAESSTQLMNMDTTIALSIAMAPIDI